MCDKATMYVVMHEEAGKNKIMKIKEQGISKQLVVV